MNQPIPVTIIGGYLGAGKTTLVNQMLRQAEGVRLAILVNEFGALPIDEDLIEAEGDDLISIAGGCICCSFGSDLTAALLELTGMENPPDHIVIETSGVALPGAIASSIDILDSFEISGICVLADCAQAQRLAADEYIGDTITRQFSDAHLLLMTKADLLNEEALAAFEAWLAEGWPETRRIAVSEGRVPNAVLLGTFDTGAGFVDGGHDDKRYDSLFLPLSAPQDAAQLAQRLTAPDLGVIRAKGFVSDVSGQTALIQIVGKQAEVSFAPAPGALGLICIGLKGALQRDALLKLP